MRTLKSYFPKDLRSMRCLPAKDICAPLLNRSEEKEKTLQRDPDSSKAFILLTTPINVMALYLNGTFISSLIDTT